MKIHSPLWVLEWKFKQPLSTSFSDYNLPWLSLLHQQLPFPVPFNLHPAYLPLICVPLPVFLLASMTHCATLSVSSTLQISFLYLSKSHLCLFIFFRITHPTTPASYKFPTHIYYVSTIISELCMYFFPMQVLLQPHTVSTVPFLPQSLHKSPTDISFFDTMATLEQLGTCKRLTYFRLYFSIQIFCHCKPCSISHKWPLTLYYLTSASLVNLVITTLLSAICSFHIPRLNAINIFIS